MSAFQSMKHEIVHVASLSKDALHIYVGIGVFLVCAAFSNKGLRSVFPIIAVAALAVLGEALDARDDLRKLGHWRYLSSLHDLLNTLFWPLALWLLARYSRVMK
ncbi:MAG TPA: hypothetical protein VN762_10520 [Steroidobacteraceae bacterium]|nr:hypothetical protein [Steroidobacteraceae bacterium]